MALSTNTFDQEYKLIEFIANGKYADVHVCEHIETSEKYAAKIINKKLGTNSRRGQSVESIGLEIEILKELNHPNIIKIYETFVTIRSVILILEYVPEGELFDYIVEREVISEDEASKFVYQILLGVNHIHSKGFLHLDLKPENILVEDKGSQKIKIIDFGLAKKKGSGPVYALQGTTGFLAPEVINYEPLTFATDMWSVGIITFLMLTGYNPFAGESQNEIHSNIVRCQVDYEDERFTKLSDIAKDFVKSLLLKRPSERKLSDECLKHNWIRMDNEISQRKRNSWIDKEKTEKLKNFVILHKEARPVSMVASNMPNISDINRLSLPLKIMTLEDNEEDLEGIDIEIDNNNTDSVFCNGNSHKKEDEY